MQSILSSCESVTKSTFYSNSPDGEVRIVKVNLRWFCLLSILLASKNTLGRFPNFNSYKLSVLSHKCDRHDGTNSQLIVWTTYGRNIHMQWHNLSKIKLMFYSSFFCVSSDNLEVWSGMDIGHSATLQQGLGKSFDGV